MIIIHEPDTKKFSELLANDLQCKTLEIKIEQFSNGEFKIDPISSDDPHALVIFSNGDDLNSQLLKFFLILENLRGFQMVDIFIPYIPYSRQDKSVSFQATFNMFKKFNVRKIITIDIHKAVNNPMIINILPHQLFGERFKGSDFAVAAPDNGAISRAKEFAEYLGTSLITIDKISGKTQNLEIANGRKCLIVDDIVDTGKTLKNAEKILKSAGASEIVSCISDSARNNLIDFHDQIAKILI